jgi:hypothetical protein
MLYSRHAHAGGIPLALTDSLQTLLSETAQALQGRARRLLMARTVKARGPGGPQRAARALRWGRMTRRQGMHERASGVLGGEALALRGRQRAAVHLPHLLPAIHALVARPRQADPQGRSHRLATRLTAAAGRRQVSAQQGAPAAGRPPAEPLGTPWHDLGD